ncbi:MAG: phosphopantothenoylcysteine decarboxylase [Spirochaetes bacterium]|nr:phosphopantothenoylcysteine decarboxylase [Spirochaetota bacterium]
MLLNDKKIIVTGGPTREWIDPVRYISNASSGKMGIAIADMAARRGWAVVFIHGPIDATLIKNKKYRTVSVESTSDLLDAVISELTPDTVLIMAAAPADYAPLKKSETKIKKEAENDELTLRLKKNPDILKHVADKRRNDASLKNIFVAGFAAETNNIEEYALKKLKEKNLDMICLNDVSRTDAGFSKDTNVITIFTRGGERIALPLLKKDEAASEILNKIEAELHKIK